MFEDSMVALMFMQFLSFAGILVMFLFIIRSLGAHTTALQEQNRQTQAALADLERQLMDATFQLKLLTKPGTEKRPEAPFDGGTTDLRVLLDAVNEQSSQRIARQVSVANIHIDPQDDLLNPHAPSPKQPTSTVDVNLHDNSLPDLQFAGSPQRTRAHGGLALRLDE